MPRAGQCDARQRHHAHHWLRLPVCQRTPAVSGHRGRAGQPERMPAVMWQGSQGGCLLLCGRVRCISCTLLPLTRCGSCTAHLPTFLQVQEPGQADPLRQPGWPPQRLLLNALNVSLMCRAQRDCLHRQAQRAQSPPPFLPHNSLCLLCPSQTAAMLPPSTATTPSGRSSRMTSSPTRISPTPTGLVRQGSGLMPGVEAEGKVGRHGAECKPAQQGVRCFQLPCTCHPQATSPAAPRPRASSERPPATCRRRASWRHSWACQRCTMEVRVWLAGYRSKGGACSDPISRPCQGV